MRFKIQYLYLVLALGIIITQVQAEIPNAGFENWTAGEPDNWTTNNISGQLTTVTQSTNSRTGSSAAQLTVVDAGAGFGIPPLLSSIDPNTNFFGFPISQNYAELTGYYQFTPIELGLLSIQVNLFHISGADTLQVAAGGFVSGDFVNSYTAFSVPLFYLPGSQQANWAWINIQITDTLVGLPSVGTTGLIDDLAFQGVVGIENKDQELVITDYVLEQNYPNPFNPSTNIAFSIPKASEVEIIIYDQLGREVDRLLQGLKNAGTHTISWSAENLPSGIYYYQLQTEDRALTRKMILMK
jgi:hypothetical protein